MRNRLPKQWLEASPKKQKSTKKHVHARVDMSENTVGAGNCPVCKNAMEGPVFANAKPMYVCWQDRVAVPLPDKQHKEIKQDYVPYTREQFTFGF